jgi:putative membrane protein
MTQHIILMNVLAPLLILRFSAHLPDLGKALVPASFVQMLLIWGWHAPFALATAIETPALHILMQASLLLGALWFWASIMTVAGSGKWRPILALLVTSKLFCLLGALLVFAPRALYAIGGSSHVHGPSADLLADQQIAGLLMLAACPATYLLAGTVIAARWLGLVGQETMSPARNMGDG